MISSAVAGIHIYRINKVAPQTLERMKVIKAHLNMFAGLGQTKAIDPRELLRCVNESRDSAIQLRHQLTELAELRSSVQRKHMAASYGTFASGYQGVVKRICVEFDNIDVAARKIQAIARDRMNEPGQYGDASMSAPITDLIGLISQILEFWLQMRVRNKLRGT